MEKIAVLFAGQGSQYPGMGKSLYDTCPASRAVFDAAGDALKSICFEGTAEELAKTENTQPCVYTVSMAIWAAVEPLLRQRRLSVFAMAGFSLGEWSAVTASGLFSFDEGLSLVRERAALMASCANGRGGMCAAMGELELVESLCAEASSCGMVLPVNYNCPGQTVVSADHAGMERFLSLCGEHKIRTVPLKVSAPFHSPILEPAAFALRRKLDSAAPGVLNIPVYSNIDANAYTMDTAAERLSRQLAAPVRWEATIRRLISEGTELFIEIGPGKTLSGFNRRIDKSIPTISVESPGDIVSAVT